MSARTGKPRGKSSKALRAHLRWYAGRHPGKCLRARAHAWNAERANPLHPDTVERMARGVLKDRAEWDRDGHDPAWLAEQAAKGSTGGQRKAENRRWRTMDRDARIVAARESGASWAEIAAEVRHSVGGVRHVVRRDAPHLMESPKGGGGAVRYVA